MSNTDTKKHIQALAVSKVNPLVEQELEIAGLKQAVTDQRRVLADAVTELDRAEEKKTNDFNTLMELIELGEFNIADRVNNPQELYYQFGLEPLVGVNGSVYKTNAMKILRDIINAAHGNPNKETENADPSTSSGS